MTVSTPSRRPHAPSCFTSFGCRTGRADRIGEFYGNAKTRRFIELLIDIERIATRGRSSSGCCANASEDRGVTYAPTG